MSNTFIPELWSAGSFEANPPFDTIVNPKVYYTAEADRTIPEMQANKKDLYKLVYKPAGFTEEEYQQQLAKAISEKQAIIALTSKGNPTVYVPSGYLKSYPLVDGVIYEHLCIISDCGAVPPELKYRIDSAIDHFNEYLKSSLGLVNPKVSIGTIPTRGYVTREQAEIWERTRQGKIEQNPSDVYRLEEAKAEIARLSAYVLKLEGQLKQKAL